MALSRATPGCSTSASPIAGPPTSTWLTAAGAPASARAWASSEEDAQAHSGACSDGFHTTVSPQTRATAVFQDHTATGKLNALMTPTTPNGCQVSISRWPGRSDTEVVP